MGLRKVKVFVKGPVTGESAIRTIHGAGIEVMEIVDVTRCRTTAAAHLKQGKYNQ